MSKPVFEDLFNSNSRRNRKSYFLYSLAIWAVSIFFITLALILTSTLGSVVFLWIRYIVALLLLISKMAVATQRFRDFGWSGWFGLLGVVPGTYFLLPVFSETMSFVEYLKNFSWSFLWLIVPLVNFVFALMLWFRAGDQGKNKYGKDPLAKS